MKKSRLSLYPCDNCGRKHHGYYEESYGEWEFVWTDKNGEPKRCSGCKTRRDPCRPREECWRCDLRAQQAFYRSLPKSRMYTWVPEKGEFVEDTDDWHPVPANSE